MWIFDSADGTPRLLRGREGHKGSSTRIRFYGAVTTASMRDNADGMRFKNITFSSIITLIVAKFCQLERTILLDYLILRWNLKIVKLLKNLFSRNWEYSAEMSDFHLSSVINSSRHFNPLGFDYCETRQYDWSDVATIHQNHSNTYLWRFR